MGSWTRPSVVLRARLPSAGSTGIISTKPAWEIGVDSSPGVSIRMALATVRNPNHLHQPGIPCPMSDPLENHTWISALHDAGYVTSMSGKYHNAPPQGYVPNGWVSACLTLPMLPVYPPLGVSPVCTACRTIFSASTTRWVKQMLGGYVAATLGVSAVCTGPLAVSILQ